MLSKNELKILDAKDLKNLAEKHWMLSEKEIAMLRNTQLQLTAEMLKLTEILEQIYFEIRSALMLPIEVYENAADVVLSLHNNKNKLIEAIHRLKLYTNKNKILCKEK